MGDHVGKGPRSRDTLRKSVLQPRSRVPQRGRPTGGITTCPQPGPQPQANLEIHAFRSKSLVNKWRDRTGYQQAPSQRSASSSGYPDRAYGHVPCALRYKSAPRTTASAGRTGRPWSGPRRPWGGRTCPSGGRRWRFARRCPSVATDATASCGELPTLAALRIGRTSGSSRRRDRRAQMTSTTSRAPSPIARAR